MPAGTRLVEVSKRGLSDGRASVRGAPVDVELYDPDLQSPEYGGGPARTRHVPAVCRGPARRPAGLDLRIAHADRVPAGR